MEPQFCSRHAALSVELAVQRARVADRAAAALGSARQSAGGALRRARAAGHVRSRVARHRRSCCQEHVRPLQVSTP